MNDTLDENLAQSLFERAAEKCKDKGERILFCKRYLTQHGVGVYNMEKPEEESLIDKEYNKRPLGGSHLAYPEDVHLFHVKSSINGYNINMATNETALKESVKADLVRKLMMDMAHNGMIHFEEHKNFALDTVEIVAAIKVAKWSK